MQGERQRAAAWRSPLPVFLYTPLDCLGVWWRGGVARLASECGHSGVAASRLKPLAARAATTCAGSKLSRVPRVLLHLCERGEDDRAFVDLLVQVGDQRVAELEQVIRHRVGPLFEEDDEQGALHRAEFDVARRAGVVDSSRMLRVS